MPSPEGLELLLTNLGCRNTLNGAVSHFNHVKCNYVELIKYLLIDSCDKLGEVTLKCSQLGLATS